MAFRDDQRTDPSARAALEEGILPGGGVALLRASTQVKSDGLSHDEKAGYSIIVRACSAPIHQIAENAGQDGGVVVAKVAEQKGNHGYDALNDEYTDLVKAGIIDPTKVTRSALQNAASIAALMLTTEAMITNIKEDEKENAARIEGSIR